MQHPDGSFGENAEHFSCLERCFCFSNITKYFDENFSAKFNCEINKIENENFGSYYFQTR